MKKEEIAPPETPKLMCSKEVAALMCVSVRTLWRLVAKEQFPQPIRYNRTLVRWKRSEVLQHIESVK